MLRPQLVLTLDALRVWIAYSRLERGHVHQAWFIPVVGNLVVPLAGTMHLGGTVTDPAARILLHLATFQALLLLVQAGALRKSPVTLSAWGVHLPAGRTCQRLRRCVRGRRR